MIDTFMKIMCFKYFDDIGLQLTKISRFMEHEYYYVLCTAYSHPYKTLETEINTKFTFMYRYKLVSLHKYKLVLRKPREFTVKPCQLFRDQFLYFIFSIRGEIIISIWCSIIIDYFFEISVRFISKHLLLDGN